VQGYPIPKIILQSHDIFQQLTIFKEFRFLKKLRISMKIFTKFMTYSKEAELVPGAKALIEFFKGAKECKLYLVSHNQTKTILEHVERLEIKDYFTGIYGADEIPALKPDPKAFNPVLNQHKECGIKQFLVLGDMPTDIQAAKEAGLHSIAVASGISTKEILSAYYPDLLVESLEELKKIIDNKDISNFESKNSLKIKS
ncbi:MAG: HAD-IA family hydrolase, partial [Candidatus Lokiarchaeota archaeon]|nr:HAD-IA family hydrolase [Candidatus Lokiarchaeota archaeon]MBD3340859.1 HAD-IA family hydrolase [Candidatus Lokiarchaeota archaeon]